VRVIGGEARGRTLKGPPRTRHADRSLRPTSDLLRGVIFNMLDAMGAAYDRVLDLYAGTGALGIEALSRGDGEADFVETDPAAIRVVESNLALTRFQDRARIHRISAELAPSRLRGVYTLVLADAPYYDTDAFAAAAAVAASPLCDARTVIVVEHHRGVEPPAALGSLPLYRSRRHGQSVVSIYAQEEHP
jgi:16S rRNA (guanine966-N2)-methyltransferase